MNKIYVGSLLLLAVTSYSQQKIEPGTYISTNAGQEIKLNLKGDKKYELVVFYGDYEIKNDTLQLGNSKLGNDFNVAFSSDANPALGKVKVKMIGNSVYYTGIYLGTQSGSSEPSFKSISELIGTTESEKTDSEFEINRSDFFYLVNENYNGESTLNKFSLPKSAKEIQIKHNPNYLGKVELQGYFNENNELVVSEKDKRNPLIFIEESKMPKELESQVKPVEITKKKNWTYAGKDISNLDYFGAVDSTATPATSYKIHTQDNLQKAMEATKKTPKKFLILSYDPDNKNGKSEFKEFIKNQEYSIGTYISYEYGGSAAEIDKYNYYNATSKDKSWAAKNKIIDNPSTIVLDSEGNILSQTKGNIITNTLQFEVYSTSVPENLKMVKAMIDLNKAINTKQKDAEILKKLVPLSALNDFGYNLYPQYSPPVVEEAVAVEEGTQDVAVDTVAAYSDFYGQNEIVYTKIDFDKKKLLSTWESIVKSHSKDVKPDMDFVKVAQSEIQNSGFYKVLFKEERLFDETNFKAIDYLIKHYDAILKEQKAQPVDTVSADYGMYAESTIETILPNAILANSYMTTPETPLDYQLNLVRIYKKIMEKQGANSAITSQYFIALEGFARNSDSEKEYVSEYNTFFNTIFKGTNEIEILDEMFSNNNQADGYDWQNFKISYATLSNQAAWFVVEKSKDPESIKKAIKWSESSLRIEKNNPYYLDTLAQLYYKNGEKQKAISTQESALKYATDIEENTKQDLETVLQKMKNGTY